MKDKQTGGKIRDILKKPQLFWKLSNQQIDNLAVLAQELAFSSGDRVYRAGDSASYLYIVEKGKVSL